MLRAELLIVLASHPTSLYRLGGSRDIQYRKECIIIRTADIEHRSVSFSQLVQHAPPAQSAS
jgi:hypothetical protein